MRTVLISFLASTLALTFHISASELRKSQLRSTDASVQTDLSLIDAADSENVWAAFQHDSAHSGHTQSGGPHTPNVLWKHEISMNPPYSVVANGKIFLGSQNTLYCLDANTGSPLWQSQVYEWVFSIAEDEGKVFVGGINSTYLTLSCLNETDGRLLWSYDPSREDGHRVFEATPVAVTMKDEKMYASAYVKNENSSYLLCVNESNGALLWSFSLADESIRCSPVTEGSRVFMIGSGTFWINATFGIGHSNLYCVNAINGGLIWKHALNLDYSGPEFPISIVDDNVIAPFSDTKVICVKASDGGEVWEYEIPDYNSPVSGFAVAQDEVFVGSYRRLDVLNHTSAELIWDINGTEAGIEFGWTVPLIAQDRLYLSTDHPQGVWCFNSTTGERLWNHVTVTRIVGRAGSGSIAEGKLFIPLFDGDWSYLFCFEDRGEGIAVWPSVSDDHCDVNSTQTIRFRAIWTADGSVVTGGSISVNGTEHAVDSSGLLSFNHTSYDVTEISWVVTAANCSSVTKYFQMGPIAEVTWDTVKIFDAGTSPSWAVVGETLTVWFKAAYQYDNEDFSGLLLINDSYASYSASTERWEYSYVATAPGTVVFEVTGVTDGKYGLKTVNNAVGLLEVNVHGVLPWWVIVALLGIVFGAVMTGYHFWKRRTRPDLNAHADASTRFTV